uniref:Putative baculovirus polyhedron envelope protein n=1 Tax=viral metagenome TaxID=1070528 RepID=A0A6H1ZZ29_9ZZZZ
MAKVLYTTYRGQDIYIDWEKIYRYQPAYWTKLLDPAWYESMTDIKLAIDVALTPPPPPPPPPLEYVCPTCGAKFSTQAKLDAHIASAHPLPPPPPADELIETFQGVKIYWSPTLKIFKAQVTPAYLAVGYTLEECKIEIAKILDFLTPPPLGTWPWPMTGVQEWFEALWDKVVSGPLAALNSFWTAHIEPKLTWMQDRLEESIDWVYNKLEPIISGVATAVLDVWTSVSTSISNMWTAISTGISDIGSWIWNQINPVLTAITTKITNVWDDLSTAVGGVITNITTALTNVRKLILDKVIEKANDILSGISTSLGNVADSLWTAIGTGFDNVGTWISTSTGAIWDSVLGLSSDLLNGMATSLGTALSGLFDGILKSLGNTAEMIFGAVNFVIAKLRSGVMLLLGSFLDVLTNAFSSSSPPKEIMVASNVLMQTSWQKQINMIDVAYKSEPTAEGLQQSAIDIQTAMIVAATVAIGTGIAADLAHPLKNMGFRPTIREMVYWSGIPAVTAAIATTPTAIGLLTPLRYALMKKWMPMKPAADDIIRFSVREVYRPERREALLVDYPGAEYQDLMAFNGFLPVFAEHFWMAHWILPSISQLNEMLYRGHIDRSVWMKYVEYNDYIPEMIPKLEKIIYSPYTRVDIRRMWDMRVVTEAEVLENYKWLGYDDEHAQRMTLWTKIYTLESELRSRYSKGWITADTVRTELLDAGMPEKRIDEWVEKIVKSGQADRMTAERDLTKTDILRLFKLNLMSDNEAIGMLQDLGYDEDEASYLIQIQKYEPEIVLRELTMSQILKSYSNEIYTRNETKNALLEAGWSEQAAETLLKLEDIKLKDAQTVKMMEKELSRTDIVKGIKVEIIDANTGYMYLQYLGYSDWEIGFIFALEGIE